MARSQKFMAKVSWIRRPAAEAVVAPKLEALAAVTMVVHRTRLKGLSRSTENFVFTRSRIAKLLVIEADSDFVGHPRSQSNARAVLPNEKAAGDTKAPGLM